MTGLRSIPLLTALLLAACAQPPAPQTATMSFFVTSLGPGRGADLGGLEGADAHCQALATAAGAGQRSWRAYLSQQSNKQQPSIDARDRIGTGPWHNARGELIAANLDELHGASNRINRDTALSEHGQPTPGRWHDILTGTRADGTAPSPLDPDLTCKNWTSAADNGAALVGHHDRASAIKESWATSWLSAHQSRGCSAAKLSELGSGGLFYCFAK
ncbi:hypothetical protein PEC18_18010 [Paucibacter sp. O1-1]|nr:hypothetical protein [Paucibacter sp. O1-1]MDA3827695.1 hypothetical protein [Paucibacter sp. O1-1]